MLDKVRKYDIMITTTSKNNNIITIRINKMKNLNTTTKTYTDLHATATKAIELEESLQSQLVSIYNNNNFGYCVYLDENTNDSEFMKGLKGVQNNLNLKGTQEAIFGENPEQKVSLTKVKNPMIKAGLYPESMLGKYVFHIEDKPTPVEITFEEAMIKLMKKHNITMEEMRTKILNENFK